MYNDAQWELRVFDDGMWKHAKKIEASEGTGAFFLECEKHSKANQLQAFGVFQVGDKMTISPGLVYYNGQTYGMRFSDSASSVIQVGEYKYYS